MADTFEATVNNATWADTSQGNATGFFTNRSDSLSSDQLTITLGYGGFRDAHTFKQRE